MNLIYRNSWLRNIPWRGVVPRLPPITKALNNVTSFIRFNDAIKIHGNEKCIHSRQPETYQCLEIKQHLELDNSDDLTNILCVLVFGHVLGIEGYANRTQNCHWHSFQLIGLFWRLMFYEDFHKIVSVVWFHPRKGGIPPGYPRGEKGQDAQRCGGWEDGDRALADSRTLHRWLGKNGMWTKLFLSCYHFPSCKLPHAGHYSPCSQALGKTFHGFENSTVFLTLVQLDHFGISDLVADVSRLGSYDSCLLFSRLPLHSDQRSPFLAAQGRCGPSFPRSPLLQNLGPGRQAPMSFYFYFPNSLLSVSKPSVFCPQITFFPP